MQKMLQENKKIHKFLSTLIIVAILAPVFAVSALPKKAEAQYVVSDPGVTAIGIKDLAGQAFKQVKMIVARKIINAITQRTVQWINSGFHGNPFYLENTESFFKDIVKFEVKNLVDTYAYNKTKFPFGKSFALNTINAYQRQLEDNTAYSLSKVIQDSTFLESYRTDFNVGGWNGFLINTQYPQNNYIGFQMLATEEIARRIDGTATNKAQQVQDTLQKGQGFLSPKKCMDPNTKYNNGKNEFLQPSFDTAKYNKEHPPEECFDLGDIESRIACQKQWNVEFKNLN